MEKLLETASVYLNVGWGGMEFQGITKAGVTEIARLWRLRYGALLLALWGKDSEKEQWPLLALLSGKKLPLQHLP